MNALRTLLLLAVLAAALAAVHACTEDDIIDLLPNVLVWDQGTWDGATWQ